MPSSIKIGDQNNLVNAVDFPYAKFKFPSFNPVQSRVFEIYDKDCNALIAAPTSCGKTAMAEMYISHEVRVRGGKALYLGPLRALAKEKIDEWTDKTYHFADKKVAVVTGDYRLTPARKKELEEADIILMTCEMLSSRVRNYTAEQNDFLTKIGTIVIDEFHTLTVPGRGDHLEVALMKFAEINPLARMVCLSATMPNVDELSDWVTTLTQKDTYLLESKFRPCPLRIHYELYWDRGTYDEQESEKINTAIEIIQDHPDDRFLLFVHTKRTGEKLKETLSKHGYQVEFHNADLDKSKRQSLETKFRQGNLQYIVATSGLAQGLNFPARRVIVLGVHRGLQVVENYDIFQQIGRAGRPGYDPRGDAYILLPERKEEYFREKLKTLEPIQSRLLDNVSGHYKTLAFHVVSEIHHGRIKTKDDIKKWYVRSLAHFQANGSLDETIIDSTVDSLLKFGVIKEEDGAYKVTSVGMISSMFYYSPFDVADLRKNFSGVFQNNCEDDDLYIAMALGNTDSLRMGIVSRNERDDMSAFNARILREFGKDTFLEPAVKAGFAYYCCMNGISNNAVAAFARTLQWDFPRITQVLQALDSMGTKWDRRPFLEELEARVVYGVSSKLIPFVKLPGIAKVRAERLYSLGFRTLQDIVDKPVLVKTALNMKAEAVQDIVKAAEMMILTDSV